MKRLALALTLAASTCAPIVACSPSIVSVSSSAGSTGPAAPSPAPVKADLPDTTGDASTGSTGDEDSTGTGAACSR